MRSFLTASILLATFLCATAQDNEAYFLSNPCLTPDGTMVIFSYEGDLWKADVRNGQASRITAMQGYETNPRVSPDGKLIAFTGRQFGNADVYVMPINGGEIRQLTWHSASDEVSSWSWDNQSVYFTSNRYSSMAGYKVNVNGGTPLRIFGNHYFQYDHNLVEHPVSGAIFFNDTWESSSQLQRKRYKGAFNPDIQSYNPVTHQYKKYTSWEGKDFGATIDRKGSIYFLSDEVNNEYNLYTFAGDKKTPLTSFPTSLKSANVSADGRFVVFEKDYQLWLYDIARASSGKIPVQIFRNNVLSKEKDFEVRGNIEAFAVSPDTKKLAFISRGELFVSDAEGKFIRQMKRGREERAREVKWLADNKTLLFSQTLAGYTNYFTVAADGSSPVRQITTDTRNNRSLSLNKARTKAVYLSGRDQVRIMDTKTFESKTIVNDEIWGFQGSDPVFSPNGDYVLFTAFRNFEQDIFIYNIKDNKTTNITKTGVTEAGPQWSPDGKYIYFYAQRLKAAYPAGLNSAHIYRLPLEKLDDPYRADKYNDLFKEEKKDTTKKDISKKDSISKKTDTSAPVVAKMAIDTVRIMERIELVGPAVGAQYLAYVYQKGEKTTVLYTSNHGEGKFALWKTTLEPFEQNKVEKVTGSEPLRDFEISEVGDKLYTLSGGNIYKLNLEANKLDPVNINYTFRRNLSAEFTQMFDEAWAQMEENYYDEKFHGVNWKKTSEQYRRFLPYLNNRADLRILLNDMLGELNSSHQGFRTAGTDEEIVLSNKTMETGIEFSAEAPYKVKKIIRRSAADKKGVDILPGDLLVAVNDEPVKPGIDRSYYFTRPSLDKELKLTLMRGTKKVETELHPQPSLAGNLYDEWIDANQELVNSKGGGRIAYGYMKDMGQTELEQFIIDMTQELTNKEALIFDLRYNTGGNVHDDVLNFLSQRSYLQWKYREGQLSPQPNFSPGDKPIILLINEQSLSDAEMTANGFKALKLGKIIGNETYRWIIFTSGVTLVDNSLVRMPAWGCYTLDGKDLEKTGVQPDIKIINSFEDRLNGRDPQLDAAIAEILRQIK